VTVRPTTGHLVALMYCRTISGALTRVIVLPGSDFRYATATFVRCSISASSRRIARGMRRVRI
ncbi:MAG: hypothetical protein JWN03_7623, partial [Nocardia sp.]|nr:hypothetical protein [Nocardia sp.]